ncbi:type II secretion system F family protein [Microbacterium xanthum]|uniref:type II secretion system F family protein n=1 Tax=Microbacterium xanthum TaxID=3079794 RepID=UPI002AD30511|nr:type II secretion system F family protein [Microbacterium sp. KSW-48]MDZ8171892.1 type II secretion system F family protein [Microbacterium sp. KSW-48]
MAVVTAAPSPDLADPAATVLRLAVMLQAGVSPARSWQLLADSGDEAARRVIVDVAAGLDLVSAIAAREPVPARPRRRRGPVARRDGWRDVAAAWQVATTVGAPLAESLRGLSTALRDAEEAADDVRVALAEPTSTARLMAWLPVVGVVLAACFGFDTFSALTRSPVGAACLAAGILLTLAAHRWNAALVRRAGGDPRIPGMTAELLAVALSGGVSVARARDLVDRARPGPAQSRDETADDALALSQRAGVPAVDMLRAAAALARHRARVDGRLRAARLSARLLIPLGVCTLPAFLLLGVAPMMLGVLGAVPLDISRVAP